MANVPREDDRLSPSSKDKKHSLPHRSDKSPQTASESIKAVAIYEVIKGLGALIGAVTLWAWHADLEQWLNSATDSWQQTFGQMLAVQIESTVRIAQKASENWPVFLLLIFAYASMRFLEAYGLWQDKTWAYWFGVLGYGVFIPIEIYYLITSPFDWLKLGVLALNLLIVFVVYRNMKRKGLI
ncbi:DUF2127 domain-containing protein [Psychrobacter sp.]|uniref:DUF2127 domain-containing protein n=1 Tax=Psychrobacter sp. TaxID=56811 RepID=UPI003F991029